MIKIVSEFGGNWCFPEKLMNYANDMLMRICDVIE